MYDSGWGSQWYTAPFTATVDFGGEEKTIKFSSAEQWMMVHKALLFGDVDIEEEILAVNTTGRNAMAQVKSLGRRVKDFDDETWQKAREGIVLEGNLHKFRQNAGLKAKLMETKDKELVEASPGDGIWGIGYAEDKAMENEEKWGLNLLGKALKETRRILKEERDDR